MSAAISTLSGPKPEITASDYCRVRVGRIGVGHSALEEASTEGWRAGRRGGTGVTARDSAGQSQQEKLSCWHFVSTSPASAKAA
jgi:hypothetical protein